MSGAADTLPSGLFLLFPKGGRPDDSELRNFAADQRSVSITHDPRDAGDNRIANGHAAHDDAMVSQLHWVEVLREGLTFDLIGLAPGEAASFPETRHWFDLEKPPAPPAYEALQVIPGQHLAGGEKSIPVVKGLVGLARDCVHHFDELAAVVWPQSASAIGRRYFESISTAWLDGGAFPALGLTAFNETNEGALQSEGLDFWIGQELRIEPPISSDKAAATRLGVRLINQLVLVGGVNESERVVAPDGTQLVMRPSRNGQFVQVWRE